MWVVDSFLDFKDFVNFAELGQKESIKEKEGETDVIFKELMEIKDDKAMGIHKTVWGYIDT